jgi:hypothetical protein
VAIEELVSETLAGLKKEKVSLEVVGKAGFVEKRCLHALG